MFESKYGRKVLDEMFDVGISIKGINGALDVIGGLLLFFIPLRVFNAGIGWIVKKELNEDPSDFVSNFLMNLANHFTLHAKYLFAAYLLFHGIINILLVISLWRKKIWAYPLASIFLMAAIFYQIYRLTVHFSGWLFVLTIFDLIVTGVILAEYRMRKK